MSNPSAVLSFPRLASAIFLTTMATLLFELSLTRIFSVIFYYHFAFLAISVALFGLGLGGIFSYVFAGKAGNPWARIGWLSALAGVSTIGTLAYVLTREGQLDNATLALVYLMSALPFFFAGASVSLAIEASIQQVHRVYFFDLLGAAAGCLLLIPMLDRFGGPNTVLACGLILCAASIVWFSLAESRFGMVCGAAILCAMGLFLAVNGRQHILDVRFAKGVKLDPEQYVRWNSFSRIALTKPDEGGNREIYIDADASTTVMGIDLDHLTPERRRALFSDAPAFAYRLRPASKALIIGPGGGVDMIRALASGSRDLTAVEINPIIANVIMREKYPEYSKGLYLRPEVHVQVADGRNFVRRSGDRYQVIQASLVDTWASTAAGAFALTENSLYTTEAFTDYLSHLTDDGVVTFTRWGFEPPRESLRVVSLAADALLAMGETRPWRHIIVLRDRADLVKTQGAVDTVVISRKPFTQDDLSRAYLERMARRYEFLYIPGDVPLNPFGQLLRAKNPRDFLSGYEYDVSAVRDDRPFFFYTVQTRDLWRFVKAGVSGELDYKVNRALPLLFGLVGISLLAMVAIVAVPPLLLRSRLPVEKGVRTFLLYFVAIGVGYILVQVALIQKLVLLLGHPTYALTVVVFSMLLASGLGSYCSARLAASEDRWRAVLAGAAILIAVVGLVAGPVARVGVGLPLALRIALAVVLIAPAAFLMGMPFPVGLKRLESASESSVRWAWSLNAAASVLGSALAMFLAIFLGFRFTLLIGSLLYCAALFIQTRSAGLRRA